MFDTKDKIILLASIDNGLSCHIILFSTVCITEEKIKFSFAPDSRPVFPVTTFASVYEKCARAASLMPLTQHRKPVG